MISFLVLGLVFSSIFRIKFNLDDGFVFRDYWVSLIPGTILDFSGSSETHYLTTTFIGYIFYFLFGFGFLRRIRKEQESVQVLLIVLFILTSWATFVELKSMIADSLSEYDGMHFRVGPLICLLGVIVYSRAKEKI